MKPVLPSLSYLIVGLSIIGSPRLALADEPAPLHRYDDQSLPPSGTGGKLMLTGALVSAGFYLPVLGASYLWPDRKGASDMRIPVVGPWMAFGQTHLCNTEPENTNCSDFMRVAGAILLALDGIGQAGGVALMLEGLFLNTAPSEGSSKETSSVPPSGWFSRKRDSGFLKLQSEEFEVRAVPLVGGDTDLGLALVGQF